jgi:hypothetical protein
MKYSLLAGVGALALGIAAPANAGRVVLTGHDNDFHQSSGAVAASTAELSYVRAGSGLPVLVIDNGIEATNLVSGIIGGGNVVAKTVGLVTGTDFNHSVYSAFVVASVTSCGGCDNPPGTGTTLAGFATQIAAFFNAGGGILGETGASDTAAFAYVPDAVGSTVPIGHNSGFFATANGLLDLPAGYTAVNGDETHNLFGEPGSGGVSSVYKVAERDSVNGDAPTTIYAAGTITCIGAGTCTIHGAPEPMTLSLLGAGLFGLGLARRRWRK